MARQLPISRDNGTEYVDVLAEVTLYGHGFFVHRHAGFKIGDVERYSNLYTVTHAVLGLSLASAGTIAQAIRKSHELIRAKAKAENVKPAELLDLRVKVKTEAK